MSWQSLSNLFSKTLKNSKEHWSIEESIDSMEEEMGELLVAIKQFNRGRIPAIEVVEEIADVSIMIEVLVDSEHYGTKHEYYDMVEKKLLKTLDLVQRKIK